MKTLRLRGILGTFWGGLSPVGTGNSGLVQLAGLWYYKGVGCSVLLWSYYVIEY